MEKKKETNLWETSSWCQVNKSEPSSYKQVWSISDIGHCFYGSVLPVTQSSLTQKKNIIPLKKKKTSISSFRSFLLLVEFRDPQVILVKFDENKKKERLDFELWV